MPECKQQAAASSPHCTRPSAQGTEPPLSPLHLAAFAGRTDAVKALLSHASHADADAASRAAYPGSDPLLAQPHPLALAGLSGSREAYDALLAYFQGCPAADAERPELFFSSAVTGADPSSESAEPPTDVWEAIMVECVPAVVGAAY